MKTKNIFLKKDLILNKSISSEGIMVYTALVVMTQNQFEYIHTTMGILEYSLKYHLDSVDKHFRERIKNGIINLVRNDIIKIETNNIPIEDIKYNDVIIIDTSYFKINTQSEFFIKITTDELYSIMNYKEKKVENDKLLRYFLVVVGTINNTSLVGFTTLDSLSYMACIDVKTATVKYNIILEELKLLYIYRHNNSVKREDGTISKISNTYGRYAHQEEINQNVLDFHGILNEQNSPNITGDEARGIKQKYNSLMKKINNNKQVTIEEVNNMNVLIDAYNKRYRNSDRAIINKIELTV